MSKPGISNKRKRHYSFLSAQRWSSKNLQGVSPSKSRQKKWVTKKNVKMGRYLHVERKKNRTKAMGYRQEGKKKKKKKGRRSVCAS
jgi:hypothetical protein